MPLTYESLKYAQEEMGRLLGKRGMQVHEFDDLHHITHELLDLALFKSIKYGNLWANVDLTPASHALMVHISTKYSRLRELLWFGNPEENAVEARHVAGDMINYLLFIMRSLDADFIRGNAALRAELEQVTEGESHGER